MGQKSRPVSPDVSAGSWTPTPIYQRINEVTPDNVGVSSADGVSLDAFEARLAKLAWPKERGAGTHKLTVRLKKAGADPGYATVVLLQGSTIITTKNFQPGTDYEDAVLDLTAAEVARIDDYSDLRLRVIAGRISVSCCTGAPLPVVLYLNFPGGFGGCPCDMPDSVPMTYTGDPALGWFGAVVVSGPCTTGGAQLICTGSGWSLTFGAPGGCVGNASLGPADCGPDQILSGDMDFTSTGGGVVGFTVTKSPP